MKGAALYIRGMAGIPNWSPEGILPPIDAANPTSSNRAPYRTNGSELVVRFSTTTARHRILRGLFSFRAELREQGIGKGFQWLNGSFMEDVEAIQDRDPGDMDIVTFFYLPEGISQAKLAHDAPPLFDRPRLRKEFSLDAYFHVLPGGPEDLVDRSAYWYSVWAHQRETMAWKGFVQLDLSMPDDEAVRLLDAKKPAEAAIDG